MPRRLVAPFWLTFWSLALSWCWLLPNHYPPWSTFHMDTWSALVMLPISATVLWRTHNDRRYGVTVLAVMALALLTWLQFAAGQILMAGTAWVSFSYLLGLATMVLVGQRWEVDSPGQPGDGIFLAVGIASMLSVGLQFHQWMQFDLIQIWSMGNGTGRPFANFGQPNQLGTLLLWGLLAVGWGNVQGRIRPGIAIAAALFLMFGIALTASRTAWVGVALVALAAWHWRGLWPSRNTAPCVIALALSFFVLVWLIPYLSEALMLSSEEGRVEQLARMSSELRPKAWALLLDAAWQRPWFGYGLNQVAAAQLEVAGNHEALRTVFSHSHNLFLDLILWCGVPLGLLFTGLLLAWGWVRFRAVADASAALWMMLLLVVGNHAMLELPLHHAYFLLPVGVVVGALDARLGGRTVHGASPWMGATMWLTAAVLLAALIRDYARIESSYQALRFEWANIQTKASRDPPKVLLLDQLRELIILARFEPVPDMSGAQLDRMRHTALLFPSAGVIHKFAAALAMNGSKEEASLWLRRMCAMVPAGQCEAVRKAWAMQSKTDARLAAVSWPLGQSPAK